MHQTPSIDCTVSSRCFRSFSFFSSSTLALPRPHARFLCATFSGHPALPRASEPPFPALDMSSAIPSAELEASLKGLKISTSTGHSPSHSPAPAPGTKPSKKPAKAAVADSWEDEASGSDDGSGTETEPDSFTSPINTLQKHASEGPLAPPPTPASPQFDGPYGNIDARFANATAAAAGTAAAGGGPARRPEKTTSVAARMIAAGIGSRAPKRTEEEREYDRVMREKERKRREKEREEAAAKQEKEEEAKKAVWDD